MNSTGTVNGTGTGWHLSPRALSRAGLPRSVRDAARKLGRESEIATELRNVVGLTAREIIEDGRGSLPDWVDSETRYIVVLDVPESAILRLPEIVGLHKPDRRMLISRDPQVIRRLIVAQFRNHSFEGVVEGYVLGDSLVLTLGDLSARSFPVARIPALQQMNAEEVEAFELDADGSFLYWATTDLRMGASELMQAVDPMYLADIEIERYRREPVGEALRGMREERGLRQADVSELSERQVRRLEQGVSRLTADGARSFAAAFDLTTQDFLSQLGERLHSADSETNPVTPQLA